MDDRREGQRFTSALLPAYMRKSPKVTEVLPILYLRGLSTGDFAPALGEFFGSEAGLSASTIGRLSEAWQVEHEEWSTRDLSGVDYVYFWADGVHFNILWVPETARYTKDRVTAGWSPPDAVGAKGQLTGCGQHCWRRQASTAPISAEVVWRWTASAGRATGEGDARTARRTRRGLLGHPVRDGMRGDAGDADTARAVLDEEKHIEALEQHGVNGEEVTGQQALRLSGQELGP